MQLRDLWKWFQKTSLFAHIKSSQGRSDNAANYVQHIFPGTKTFQLFIYGPACDNDCRKVGYLLPENYMLDPRFISKVGQVYKRFAYSL